MDSLLALILYSGNISLSCLEFCNSFDLFKMTDDSMLNKLVKSRNLILKKSKNQMIILPICLLDLGRTNIDLKFGLRLFK